MDGEGNERGGCGEWGWVKMGRGESPRGDSPPPPPSTAPTVAIAVAVAVVAECMPTCTGVYVCAPCARLLF